MRGSGEAWSLYPYSEECRAAYDRGVETARRSEAILRVATAAKRENDHALDDAVQSLLRAGATVADIEIVSEPQKGPGAWRVRLRRKVCDCGRAV